MLLGGYLFFNDIKHFFSYPFVVRLEVYPIVILIYNVRAERAYVLKSMSPKHFRTFSTMSPLSFKKASCGQSGELCLNLPKRSIPRQKNNVDNKTRFSYQEGHSLC